jgi:hypothetical protein
MDVVPPVRCTTPVNRAMPTLSCGSQNAPVRTSVRTEITGIS